MTLMQRRRALMGAAKKARLPAEYQEVEWVGVPKGVANSCLWSSIYTIAAWTVEMELEITDPADDSPIIICTKRDNNPSYAYAFGDNASGSSFSVAPAIPKGMVFGKTVVIATKTKTDFGKNTMGFVGYATAKYVPGSRLYSAKAYNSNGQLIYDGVPSVSKLTSEIGLYDLVSNVFAPGQGTLQKGKNI